MICTSLRITAPITTILGLPRAALRLSVFAVPLRSGSGTANQKASVVPHMRNDTRLGHTAYGAGLRASQDANLDLTTIQNYR